MIGLCACKRGFFTLRNCEQAAVRNCGACGRPVCQEHLSGRLGMQSCVECAGRQQEDTDYDPDLSPGFNPDWVFSSRHHYYTDSDYQPVSWGQGDSYYDSYDVRSFDTDLVRGDDSGGDSSPDFGDS